MAAPFTIDQIAERVERLLLRHAELRRTNALLAEQVAALTQERDALKSRLNAARARGDALLERLPAAPSRPKEAKKNKKKSTYCNKTTSSFTPTPTQAA